MEAKDLLAEQYRLHGDAVFRRCLAMSGGDSAWAADVTQDVFLRLVEKVAFVDMSRDLRSYLLTIADRLCIDKLRRERGLWPRVRRALISASRVAPAPEPQLLPDPGFELGRLQLAIRALPAKERAAVMMKYVEGRPQVDIAVALGCSEGYVSKLLRRAIVRLRREWKLLYE
jgi:RNA polymerase sigma factor (sigma-70 family)